METLKPKLRFPEFKEYWKKNTINNLTEYVDYRGKTPNKTENGIFLITAKNIKLGYIDYTSSCEYISIEDYDEVMRRGLPKIGDVLITTEAPLGNVANIDREDIALAQRVIKYRGLPDQCNNYFLKQYFLSNNFQKILLEKSTGGTVKGIKGSVLHKIKINVPVIQEQTKIANFLSSVDNKINQLTKKKILLENYKKGVMQKIFNQEIRFKDEDGNDYPNWKSSKIGKISKIYDGTHQTPNYVDKGIPFYSVEHVSANQFETTKFISEEVFEKENKRVKLEKGDILMTRIGSIGVVKYINWDVKASFYVSLALIKQSDKINNEYLYHFITTDFFQAELWKRTIHVAFPQKINLGEISECLIKIPVIEEQTKIAKFFSAIDDKINQVAIQLDKTKEFKKGLLQQMFV